MLRELLIIIRAGQFRSQAEIARQMGISQETLSELFSQLVRMGYLEENISGCGPTACSHCDIKAGCNPSMKIWRLTEKAARV